MRVEGQGHVGTESFRRGQPISGIARPLSYHLVSAVHPTQCLDSRKVLVKISQDVDACNAKNRPAMYWRRTTSFTFSSLTSMWRSFHSSVESWIVAADTSIPAKMGVRRPYSTIDHETTDPKASYRLL